MLVDSVMHGIHPVWTPEWEMGEGGLRGGLGGGHTRGGGVAEGAVQVGCKEPWNLDLPRYLVTK